jgi:hypothetical protein
LNQAFSDCPTFSRRDLFDFLRKRDAGVKDSSLNWLAYTLCKENVIKRIYRDTFTLSTREIPDKPEYTAILSDDAASISAFITKRYPALDFIVWELFAFNDFTNHILARNYILVEVERMLADIVFESLREAFSFSLLYKPEEKELSLYAGSPTVIVQSLASEAPIQGHTTTIEKMLVDLFANKSIAQVISPDENDLIYEEVFSRYRINRAAMLRYARRRNKEVIVKEYIEINSHD